jgi:hypothetical protein
MLSAHIVQPDISRLCIALQALASVTRGSTRISSASGSASAPKPARPADRTGGLSNGSRILTGFADRVSTLRSNRLVHREQSVSALCSGAAHWPHRYCTARVFRDGKGEEFSAVGRASPVGCRLTGPRSLH